eukprot:TRINITY_DN8390_c0_g1_i1.p1 TRINITY_DN8390_c0_g1~~TRINITY_DN8390_c0_g1_i1.p1  ORF type:complete len:110 (-),score=23.02 TRINITY_DN8390_c0_g1_i1:192-521(-)
MKMFLELNHVLYKSVCEDFQSKVSGVAMEKEIRFYEWEKIRERARANASSQWPNLEERIKLTILERPFPTELVKIEESTKVEYPINVEHLDQEDPTKDIVAPWITEADI